MKKPFIQVLAEVCDLELNEDPVTKELNIDYPITITDLSNVMAVPVEPITPLNK